MYCLNTKLNIDSLFTENLDIFVQKSTCAYVGVSVQQKIRKVEDIKCYMFRCNYASYLFHPIISPMCDSVQNPQKKVFSLYVKIDKIKVHELIHVILKSTTLRQSGKSRIYENSSAIWTCPTF